MNALLAVLTVALTFLVLSSFIMMQARRKQNLQKRMEYFSEQKARKNLFTDRRRKKGPTPQEKVLQLVRSIAAKMPQLKFEGYFADLMEQADWPLLGREFPVLLFLGSALLALIVLAVTFKLLSAVIAFVFGIVGGMLYLNRHIQRRQKAFTNQLGDMLEMMANALHSGFSFLQAFELIAREMDDPIGHEAEKTLHEINVGASLEDALTHMQHRVGSPDFELVVTAVLIQRQVGGNLADILNTISDTIQERIRMRREVLALTAQGRDGRSRLGRHHGAAPRSVGGLHHDGQSRVYHAALYGDSGQDCDRGSRCHGNHGLSGHQEDCRYQGLTHGRE